MSVDGRPSAAAYSTGGGGVRLEHLYGATLLAFLLTGDPAHELGDDAVPDSVRFQASAISPVDDFLVTGKTKDSGQRRVSIGARRNPLFTSSDRDTADLLASYLTIVTDEWDEVKAGRWRLALVTGSRSAAVPEVRDLAGIAKTQHGEREFRAEVGRGSKSAQRRLVHVDELVARAAAKAGVSQPEPGELTWRLLSCLWVQETRLEDSDRRDRNHAVARLRNVTRDGTAESAETLFRKLDDLASGYDITAGDINREMLRRDLSGFPLADVPVAPVASPSLTATPVGPPASRMVSPVAVIGAPPVRDEVPGTAGPLPTPASAGEPWRAGDERQIGRRRYLLCDDRDGLLENESGAGLHFGAVGQPRRRQALARQTEPPPTRGRRYAWLRQGGLELRQERELLDQVLPGRLVACDVGERNTAEPSSDRSNGQGMVTLALSWPEDHRTGLPDPTARAWFTPGALDAWQLSILMRGLGGLMTPLERLHRLGRAHRALTLEAVVVTGHGSFVLRDLGLAAVGYRPGEGPEDYRAPEQGFGARGTRPGPAADVYRAAAMACHLITGRLPIAGITPPPVRHPDLPAAISGAIGAALATRPEDRPGSREFSAALRQ